MKTYIFFRRETNGKLYFYPVEDTDDSKIPQHVRLNPGTVRVEAIDGKILWKEGDLL